MFDQNDTETVIKIRPKRNGNGHKDTEITSIDWV